MKASIMLGNNVMALKEGSKALDIVRTSEALILVFLATRKSRLALCAKRKQKYQNGNIHRKLQL
jgi:hypothetical protein